MGRRLADKCAKIERKGGPRFRKKRGGAVQMLAYCADIPRNFCGPKPGRGERKSCQKTKESS